LTIHDACAIMYTVDKQHKHQQQIVKRNIMTLPLLAIEEQRLATDDQQQKDPDNCRVFCFV